MQNVNFEAMNPFIAGNQQRSTENKLNEGQKKMMNDIISKYDPDNHSKEDEQSMRLELKDAEIFPGRELGSALETAGFEVKKPHRKPGGPPTRPEGIKLSESQQEILDKILSKYDPANFSEEDDELLRSELEDADIFPGRELGAALNKVGLGISIRPKNKIPSGIIVDNSI